MVWSASDMLASTGAAMPEWYQQQGVSEYVQFMTDVGKSAERWTEDTGVEVFIDVTEYVTAHQVQLHLWLGGMRLGPFTSLYELECYLERMYP